MVRVNLINPKYLADQHLIAEYLEIIMLVSYARKYPQCTNIPKKYCLGKGHIKFFKDKLIYLKKRHELIKDEMRQRGFKALRSIHLSGFKNQNKMDWKPNSKDKQIIKKRIIWKIRKKPNFYRYYSRNKPFEFFASITRKA